MMKSIRPMMRSIFFAALVLPLLACACQYDPYAYLFTTEKPKAEDLVGTFLLKEQTLAAGGLSVLEGKQARIELHADGTFTASDFPHWRTAKGAYEFDEFQAITGKWEIGRVGGVSNGVDQVKDAWGIYIRDTIPDQGSTFYTNFTGNKPPYGLIFTYGDPDSGAVMIFEKAQE